MATAELDSQYVIDACKLRLEEINKAREAHKEKLIQNLMDKRKYIFFGRKYNREEAIYKLSNDRDYLGITEFFYVDNLKFGREVKAVTTIMELAQKAKDQGKGVRVTSEEYYYFFHKDVN